MEQLTPAQNLAWSISFHTNKGEHNSLLICDKLKIILTVTAQKVEDETSTAEQLEEVHFMRNSSSFSLQKQYPC